MLDSLFNKVASSPDGLQLYYKETPALVFSCEFCEIFKNTFFTATLSVDTRCFYFKIAQNRMLASNLSEI